MPDRILRVLEVRRSLYNFNETVIIIEALAEGSKAIKYRRTITLKQAFTEYDPIELRQKLNEYYDSLALRLRLTEKLLKSLEMKP